MAAEAKVALLLGGAVLEVLGNDAPIIQEGALGLAKADPVLFLVEVVLAGVPLKGERQHTGILAPAWLRSHIPVWHGVAMSSTA